MSAAANNKKRKKTDTKPQSQINKCLNEKRRREQENIYIEELAELISASFVDMSSRSVKPDKCAILQETVNQIRHIKQQEGPSSDAVQQGEVSSSKPTILANDIIGPLLLEALEGFLFAVNTEGKVEYVTENVSQFIKYTKDDILGESIYNIIHHGDHARFSSCLLPMSVAWPSDSQNQNHTRNRSFTCRLLIKPPDDQDETMEEKQQRVSKYENMQISSTLIPYPNEKTDGSAVTSESAEMGPCLMCVARRIPQNEKNLSAPIEQFTTKLDTSGKIISIDTSGVSSTYSQYLNKDLMGRIIQELCHQQDFQKLQNHLKETLHTGSSTSANYRLRVSSPDKYVHVQTKSKFFKPNPSLSEPEFIMATHSIIGDNEFALGECSHVSNSQSSTTATTVATATSSPSPANGRNSGVSSSVFVSASTSSGDASNTITLNTNTTYTTFTLTGSEYINDFDFFPSSTWDLVASENNLDSRQSPTPRPPSVPVYSPSAASPINPYAAATQPSPATTPSQYTNSFPFSPFQDQTPNGGFVLDDTKDTKEGILDSVRTSSIINGGDTPVDSGRLRNLLTKRPSTSTDEDVPDHSGSENSDHNQILKGLLNQEDEDGQVDNGPGIRSSPASRTAGNSRLNSADTPKTSGNNNMLLKLLNEKNEDDDLENQKQNELLQQLMRKQDEDRKPQLPIDTGQHSHSGDTLLKSLGFRSRSTPSPPSTSDSLIQIGGRKRPSDDGDDGGSNKRSLSDHLNQHNGSQVSSTGNSRLWEKNKMLASLLAKQPSTPATIPPIPESIISATPQEKLHPIVERLKQTPVTWSGGSLQTPSSTAAAPGRPNQQQLVDTRPNQSRQQPNKHTNNFLNSVLNHPDSQGSQQQQTQQSQQTLHHPPHHTQKIQMQQQQQQQRIQVNQLESTIQSGGVTVEYRTSSSLVSIDSNIWDQSDPVLSELLDQVIDIVPDAIATDSTALMSMIDAIEAPTSSSGFQEDMLKEKKAILDIQKALMQCESDVNSPSSPTLSLSGASPGYATSVMSANQISQQAANFPPPPGYQQGQRFRLHQAPGQLVRQAAGQFNITNAMPNQQQQILIQRSKIIQQQQQQQKQRLLLQQTQQQVLIPSNAAVDQLATSSIDSLLSNVAPPNVSLQRSSSVPDSQLSPGYSSQIMNSGGAQISPGQRLSQQPYSPHSQLASPLGQQQGFSPVSSGLNNFTANQQAAQARLSPHPPGGLPPFQQSQLSPRISQGQVYPTMSQGALVQVSQANTSWPQTTTARLGLQQQQNALLTNNYAGGGGGTGRSFTIQRQQQPAAQQQLPSVRSLPSPGGPRQSPYPSEQFAPPASPTTGNYQQGQLQQLRIQRTISAPSATTQLPGGVVSPRLYGPKQDHSHSMLSPSHPYHPHHHHPPPPPPQPHPVMYQTSPDPQFCYDQTSLQIYGAGDRGRPQGHVPTNHQPGGGHGVTEFVRQELRAMVDARTQSNQVSRQPSQQQQQVQSQQQQLQLGAGHTVTTADLDALGLSFETGTSDNSKIWGTIGSDIGSPSPQPVLNNTRNSMEESPRQDQKTSLLQKLLSENC